MSEKTKNWSVDILPSRILSFDAKLTDSFPKKAAEKDQMVAFTNGSNEMTLSRASIFKALGNPSDVNEHKFGITNEELLKGFYHDQPEVLTLDIK